MVGRSNILCYTVFIHKDKKGGGSQNAVGTGRVGKIFWDGTVLEKPHSLIA